MDTYDFLIHIKRNTIHRLNQNSLFFGEATRAGYLRHDKMGQTLLPLAYNKTNSTGVEWAK